MKFRVLNSIFAGALVVGAIQSVEAASVSIDYELETAFASIDPFTIPNPQEGGEDITITPSVELSSGSFISDFDNADNSGTISDGDASIIGAEYFGTISLELSSFIDVFGFPVPVSATIAGPLDLRQGTDSNGTLAGGTTYVETDIGNFDITAGPLDCTDSAFGVFCTAIETGLGLEFPIQELATESPLPFAAGTFTDLNPPSGSPGSTVSAAFDFSFPVTDEIAFGVEVQTDWVEEARMLTIPEPGSATLLLAAALLACTKRRRL